MMVKCLQDEQTLLQQVTLADSFWSRFKGLLGRKQLAPDEGLLLKPCSSVHTLGMQFAIGVVYLNRSNEILHIQPHMPPGRLGPLIKGACQVLEVNPDWLAASPLKVGSQLHFQPAS